MGPDYKKIEPQPIKIDQKRLNNWYTGIIATRAKTTNPKKLEEYIQKHKIVFREIGDLLTIQTGKGKILSQKAKHLFV